jgi:response regulator RpfG family c-di-GMP phosphodiesterase
MVMKIAACLTARLIARDPGRFVGCMGIVNREDVPGHAAKLCSFAETSALFHDIGKTTIASNPFLQSRFLTEDEKEIIRMHPVDGCAILTRDDDALPGGYIDVIMGHHKHYDNSGGYPDDFNITESKYRIMIDIIKVADSIDAATDDVGKAYADPKSFEQVCAEIKAGAGRE